MNPPATIRVTGHHIARGIPRNTGLCPVARAIKGHCGDLADVEVKLHELTVYQGGNRYTAEPPGKAQAFIQDFDDGRMVRPFEFEVEWRAAS